MQLTTQSVLLQERNSHHTSRRHEFPVRLKIKLQLPATRQLFIFRRTCLGQYLVNVKRFCEYRFKNRTAASFSDCVECIISLPGSHIVTVKKIPKL